MFDLNHIFRYHPPVGAQLFQYEAIRAAARQFAEVVIANTPESADQTAAVRKIREAAMTANAAIALDGKL
ncbi:MAG: hypothetical protein WC700_01990 [Gemmatimonadaceae bacterium]|jgi:hypothetical protein